MNRGTQLGKIKLQDVKRAIDIGKDVLPFVEPAVNKYGPALIDWGQQRGKQAADSLGEARDSFLSKGRQSKTRRSSKSHSRHPARRPWQGSLPADLRKRFLRELREQRLQRSRPQRWVHGDRRLLRRRHDEIGTRRKTLPPTRTSMSVAANPWASAYTHSFAVSATSTSTLTSSSKDQ